MWLSAGNKFARTGDVNGLEFLLEVHFGVVS